MRKAADILAAIVLAGGLLAPSIAFTVPSNYVGKSSTLESSKLYQSTSTGADSKTDIDANVSSSSSSTQTRILGSQELLMLPRQYGPALEKGDEPFPQMSHVSTAILSSTPSTSTLSKAIEEAMVSHPLLRCHVQGDGEPDQRIDLFQMVREGEPNPCTFVCPPLEDAGFTVDDVLSVVHSTEESLEDSWKNTFATNLDSGADWCNVEKGPLWKVELHRTSDGDGDDEKSSCALMFTFNHAISDQSSANLLIDHIVSNMASIEESNDKNVSKKAVQQEIPVAMEDSVLGMNSRFSDVQTDGFSVDTVKYVAGKAAEGFRSPVILPDDAMSSKDDGSGLLGALTIISGNAPGGESNEERKSTTAFRTLSKEGTTALLAKCRENGVTVSNALSAAMALTSTDFIDGGQNSGKERNYKVLQSLDMRRFGASIDTCDSVACMAGSHDLMLGPLSDRSGSKLRSPEGRTNDFWTLAKEAKAQTEEFIGSDGPQQATRVFDFAMSKYFCNLIFP